MHVKAQVIFQGGTGIPADRFVNVFHFDNDLGSLELAANECGSALMNFYGSVGQTGVGQRLAPYLSQFVRRPYEIRFYDMAQPIQRVPEIREYVLNAYSSTSGISDFPEEVAATISFHGDPPVTPSTRGRIYFGPLNSDTRTDASTTTPCRLDPSFRTLVANQCAALAALPAGWSVYSPTTETLTRVTAGFVDDAYDTQRRRGPDAVGRTIWPLP